MRYGRGNRLVPVHSRYGTASYPVPNGQGDITGTTNAAGTFTAEPVTDEFGVGAVPASRLGWLGTHQRFGTGGNLGLVRMGVRLYEPGLGRFLSVDPVEGGSANDYEYGMQDPCNNYDLDGQFSQGFDSFGGGIGGDRGSGAGPGGKCSPKTQRLAGLLGFFGKPRDPRTGPIKWARGTFFAARAFWWLARKAELAAGKGVMIVRVVSGITLGVTVLASFTNLYCRAMEDGRR